MRVDRRLAHQAQVAAPEVRHDPRKGADIPGGLGSHENDNGGIQFHEADLANDAVKGDTNRPLMPAPPWGYVLGLRGGQAVEKRFIQSKWMGLWSLLALAACDEKAFRARGALEISAGETLRLRDLDAGREDFIDEGEVTFNLDVRQKRLLLETTGPRTYAFSLESFLLKNKVRAVPREAFLKAADTGQDLDLEYKRSRQINSTRETIEERECVLKVGRRAQAPGEVDEPHVFGSRRTRMRYIKFQERRDFVFTRPRTSQVVARFVSFEAERETDEIADYLGPCR